MTGERTLVAYAQPATGVMTDECATGGCGAAQGECESQDHHCGGTHGAPQGKQLSIVCRLRV